ncbi:tyrosine-type recombinase/integrase [Halorientalis regularis]|uniref:Site-specific recombinase XerD n=1 Tax=Halorientalis regularis TaxID=660518 RepID=A0A1G7LXL5_9EURY|nr:tyrosine-type recombinase/integrase [Halorientalis regularis]SDF53689.1 Site-specific recombinase XerD [Halorientalis regularis]
MEPERAVERYLKERRPEVAESTYRNHKYALKQFIQWCNQIDLNDISELDGWHIHDFKIHRREEGGVNEVTLYNNLCTLRVFLRWLESMEVVDGDLADNMVLPNPEDDARTDMISVARANEMLDYLEKFEYATFRHALFALMWDTGFRIGTVRALDLEDYHSEDRFIEVVHRPEEGTPLKNKHQAERQVNLHSWVCDIVGDYIEIHREESTDDFGRDPLFTTKHGRPARPTFRPHISALTRPCHYTGECPHDREILDCEAYDYNYAQRCPSSVSPHAVRRSAITAWLNEGHRKELIGDRMNVSPKTLDKHYDARTKEEKRDLRREMFDIE